MILIRLLHFIKKSGALAFVSVSNINQLWCTLMDDIDRVAGVHQFFDYVTDTWIDSDSLFPKKLWNYYCFQGLRTNNGLDGWHHSLNSNVGVINPNLYLVLEKLKNDYIFNMATLVQVKHQENKQS